MATKIADRLQWAVDTLDVQPDEQILEIGCGHGVAVSLVCDRLASGKITALDQSERMIQMTAKRNRACLDAGKLTLYHTSLAEAAWESAVFDTAFAVHVNVFWMQPKRELAAVRAALKPDGCLFLFYQPLDANGTDRLIANLTDNLQANGFPSVTTLSAMLASGLNVCVMGRLR